MLALIVAAAVATPQLSSNLQPLAFLVGHCWQGPIGSGQQVDTHCFEPALDGMHVRDRHEVTGGKKVYRGETIYSFNANTKVIEYTYWSNDGGVTRGTLALKGDVLDFGDESYTGPDGKQMTISTRWERRGGDSYVVIASDGSDSVTGRRETVYRRVNRP